MAGGQADPGERGFKKGVSEQSQIGILPQQGARVIMPIRFQFGALLFSG